MVFAAQSLMVSVFALLHRPPRAERWSRPGEIVRDLRPARPAIAAPVPMLGGMRLGVVTPTEAAAVAAAHVILISAVASREPTPQHLSGSVLLTVRGTSSILVIAAAAALFGWILAAEQIPRSLPQPCPAVPPIRWRCSSSPT